MSRDERFDALMATLDAPMAIVTTTDGEERAGCLVGFHSQCSIEPRRYIVWLSKANHTYRVVLHADHLAVHLLTADDADLAEVFGTLSGDDVDKFSRCEWEPGPGGVPLLTRCPNRIVGRRSTMLDEVSDHVCVLVEPVEASADAGFEPLRLSAVDHLVPGHTVEERPTPATERDAG